MDVHLARRWANDGLLPNFARVLSTWPSLPTENPLGLIVGGLWPSFWSRSGVGHHGSYSYRQLVPGTYTTERITPADIVVRPFWLDLDDAAQRCVIFDVPLVRPIPLQHGVHIVDWGSHDAQLPTTITDPAVAERLATLGPYPQRSCDAVVRGHVDGYERLLDALLAGVRQRREAISLLLDDDVDFLAAVFSESHCAGHQFFHLHDPLFPGHDPALVQRLGGDPMLAVYRALDDALGELLEVIPDDAHVMVLLSHGFGPHYDGSSMLNTILQRIEARHRPLTGIARWRRVIPARVRGAGRRLQRRFRPNPRERYYIDETRPWFTMPNNDLYGAIRLNLRGREPHGRVRPGDDAEAAVELLTNELMSITHEESGAPAVRRVVRVDDVHAGPRRDMLPDLCVEWNWSEPFRVLTSPTIGVLTAEVHSGRTGDHRPHGAVFTRHLALPDCASLRVEDLAGVVVNDVLTKQANRSATLRQDDRRG
jgi:hypothetical protein